MVKRFGFFAAAVCFIFILSGTAFALNGDLSRFTKDGNHIKVFIGNFTNESGQPQIMPEDFKKALAHSLLHRKAVTFKIVQNPAESDVQISGVIKDYKYSKTDPVKPTISAWALALDAVTTENYVEMKADFVITDTKHNKTIWQEEVYDYLKDPMTPEESIPKIYDKVARKFLWHSFGKPNK